MKKTLLLTLLATIFAGFAAFAQEVDGATADSADINALQQQMADLTTRVDETEKRILLDEIWRKRARYFNIGYVVQSRTEQFKDGESVLNSKLGVGLSSGKSFYLHKEPIGGVLKFGLDWSWIDINYSYYSGTGIYEGIKAHQADFAMQFGASVTVNPVHHLKISGYFRVSPTYSLCVNPGNGTTFEDAELTHGYVTFLNGGACIAWKVVSLGYEYRWGKANMKNLRYTGEIDPDDYLDDNGNFNGDFNGNVGDLGGIISDALAQQKVKTTFVSHRIYFGFRF